MKDFFKSSKYCFVIGLALWIIETFIFQLLYGWHYAPINETELYFDRAAQLFMLAGFILFIVAIVKFINKLIEEMPD